MLHRLDPNDNLSEHKTNLLTDTHMSSGTTNKLNRFDAVNTLAQLNQRLANQLDMEQQTLVELGLVATALNIIRQKNHLLNNTGNSNLKSQISENNLAQSQNGNSNLINKNNTAINNNDFNEQQCGYPKKVRSLVDDAKFDTIKNRELADERKWWVEKLKSSRGEELGSILNGLDHERGEEQIITDALLSNEVTTSATIFDFPRHISQLDECNHLLIKYEPELDPTHPGFHDLEYRARRKEVAQIAFNYKYGQRIPDVEYNEKEIQTWRYIYIRLKEAYEKYACAQHNKAIEELEKECDYSPNSIPQLQTVTEFLERKTGWRLRPAAGLLSARDFLASLAFRVFQTTQYIRHWGNPEHSVEPDCIHELIGHIPMLCDPSFAQFSQEIGIASLGASDEQIEKFATLYWFTVEFGLCRESGKLKCYGAGLLSSYGEMEHALESGKPTLKEFVPEETAVETYDDSEYQVTYYVAQTFEDAKMKIKEYAAKHLNRNYELAYDPYSNSIKVLDSLERLDVFADSIKGDILRLSQAISKIRVQEEEERRRLIHNIDNFGENKQQNCIIESSKLTLNKKVQNGEILSNKQSCTPVTPNNNNIVIDE